MSAQQVKKINVSPVLTAALTGGTKGCDFLSQQAGKYSEKIAPLKASSLKVAGKVTDYPDAAWAVVGLVLLLHGAQFKSLFLCSHVVAAFCFARVKGSVMALLNDLKAAVEKMQEDADADGSNADAKAEPKKDKKKVEDSSKAKDATKAKKLLKVLDNNKVGSAAFELLAATMACHIVMEGGLARAVLVTYILVGACKDKIAALFDFGDFEDMKEWTDLLLSGLLYAVIGFLSLVSFNLVFALTLGLSGAQLLIENGLRIAESKGRIPGEQTADAFAGSAQGLALFAGVAAFGLLWQLWALTADSGMAWYFKIAYLPAYISEGLVSLL